MSTSTAIAAPPPPTSSRLSRLNQRRLANFRRNRRGYWSFWAFR
ncbi:MAG: ABC transporter permease, partial [Gemmatimonadetes bacterium]|nr:ABC transporter permease [Gemmatimonadota bacterium]